jgi:hypothetical protein
MDLDWLCASTFAHQKELLDAAEKRRKAIAPGVAPALIGGRSLRYRLSSGIRRLADWLEPDAERPTVRLLRAVAHRELDVEQAMLLLSRNGHPSAMR